MKLVSLDSIFHVEYGNKRDLNKMHPVTLGGINFVSRSRNNLGVVARVEKLDIEPFPAGTITVTLGGTYLLSSFVQPEPFYTAQNIKVLFPIKMMTFNEKLFYCKCIELNRLKYTSHGREANKTLDDLLVPSLNDIPEWIKSLTLPDEPNKGSATNQHYNLNDKKWAWFEYQKLFTIERGRGARKNEIVENGKIPLITSIDSHNGLIGYVNNPPAHKGNVITVNRNGSVGQSFYQPAPFCSTEDVHVFAPLFKLNPFVAMFLTPLIMKEKYRYSYGRKWGIARMKHSKIKLPIDQEGNPDWQFMEDYIKSLPYSSNLGALEKQDRVEEG